MKTKQSDISGLRRVLHPQEEYGWPIALYLYLAGMGAGAFAVGLLADLLWHPNIPSKGMLLWGPLLVAIGAPFLILDLGKKTRFINACLNPGSSWAARGFVILSSLIVAGLAAFALAALPDILPIFGIAIPGWLTNQGVLSRAIEITALVLSFGTAAYTGIFLKSVRYVSLWNTWSLPVLFVFSALSTGAMLLIVFLTAFGLSTANESVLSLAYALIAPEIVLILLEGAALVWLLLSLRRAEQIPARTVLHLAAKSSPSLVVGAALLVWVLLLGSSSVMSSPGPYALVLFLNGVIILLGGFMLRFDIVKSGTKDQHPLHKMAAAQYDWKALAAPAESLPAFTGILARPADRIPLIDSARLAMRPVFEVALSVYHAKPRDPARSRMKVLAAVYRSWRHPVRLQYTWDAADSQNPAQ